jgi:hypothetical protein
MKTVTIYALRCPTTGRVRYVGKANDPAKRLLSHIRTARRTTIRRTPVMCWLTKLAQDGLRPEMIVLETVPEGQDWKDAERRQIAAHRAAGALLNVADGGDEPACSRETRVANGLMVLAAIKADPIRRGNREVLRRFGIKAREVRKLGNLALADKMVETGRRLSERCNDEPELMFYRFYTNPMFRRAMGKEFA